MTIFRTFSIKAVALRCELGNCECFVLLSSLMQFYIPTSLHHECLNNNFIQLSIILRKKEIRCFLNINVHPDHLGILVKCGFWFSRSEEGPQMLHCSQEMSMLLVCGPHCEGQGANGHTFYLGSWGSLTWEIKGSRGLLKKELEFYSICFY